MPNVDAERAHLCRCGVAFDDDTDWSYTVFETSTDLVVESVALHRTATADQVNIGYWIRSDRAGRGYATAATGLVVYSAFACRRPWSALRSEWTTRTTPPRGPPPSWRPGVCTSDGPTASGCSLAERQLRVCTPGAARWQLGIDDWHGPEDHAKRYCSRNDPRKAPRHPEMLRYERT